MEDIKEVKPPQIKKEIITREIHQWRNPDGTFAEKDERTTEGDSVALNHDLKAKLKELRTTPKESFRSVIYRLVKEHYILGIVKRKLIEQQNENKEE